jgi:hypothetical protein
MKKNIFIYITIVIILFTGLLFSQNINKENINNTNRKLKTTNSNLEITDTVYNISTQNKNKKSLSLGSHMNGKFITYDGYWNVANINFKYSYASQPSEITSDMVETAIATAF